MGSRAAHPRILGQLHDELVVGVGSEERHASHPLASIVRHEPPAHQRNAVYMGSKPQVAIEESWLANLSVPQLGRLGRRIESNEPTWFPTL